MAEFLLELLSEEIPARMQMRAAEDLRRIVVDKLAAAALTHGRAEAFATPRRLALVVDGLPLAQPDSTEEKKGPRVGAPEAAIQGFLRSTGLPGLDQCEKRMVGKAEFWFAVTRRSGQPIALVLAQIVAELLRTFPWPKSMRWAAGAHSWVRPLHGIVAQLDGTPIAAAIELPGVAAYPVTSTTRGHRFLAPAAIPVTHFADYRDRLRDAFVILDPAERRRVIAEGVAAAARVAGLTVRDDPGLLEEVTGLVEWPVVLIGTIDAPFMELPAEVLTTSMRTHQKYFALLDSGGSLAPRFAVVANMATADGGAQVVAGNERVLRARLSDARFFWDQDRKAPLASRVPALAQRIFHARLGTVLDKVQRIEALAEFLAPSVPGAEAGQVRRAAHLCKADLSTGMVGEFPELQGIMGRYYAQHDGETPAVAEAIGAHYQPLGPNDRVPTAPVAVAVALADKLDTLAGFFRVDEKPTGSKDPFALRRAALGVIRIVFENDLRLRLGDAFRCALELHGLAAGAERDRRVAELGEFFVDRLKVYFRERGLGHDLIAAVFALGEDDIVALRARAEALKAFLATEDGANLLTAYRRGGNIVAIEERKDKASYGDAVDRGLLSLEEEVSLSDALEAARTATADALGREDYTAAMAALATLRAPIDAFFDKVTVNAPEPLLRTNRLRLLSAIRDTLGRVADFARIEG